MVGEQNWEPGRTAEHIPAETSVAIKARSVDNAALPLSGGQLFAEIRNAGGGLITALQGFADSNGYAVVKWKTSKIQASGVDTATVTDVIKNGYQFNPGAKHDQS